MIRYTTPTLIFKLPFEASYLSNAYITIKQSDATIEKTLDDCTLSEKTLSVILTQEDTGKLAAGKETRLQVRCTGNDNKKYASKIKKLRVDDVLKEGVI
jgi:molybdopterin-biosynthesis enzyme MoeA-like protein